MLGSGKGCVKPPDIVLHGTRVAPQHAFVERIANEAMLHPISEETSIDGRHVKGPTPLHSGEHLVIRKTLSISFSFEISSNNFREVSSNKIVYCKTFLFCIQVLNIKLDVICT